MKTRFCVLAAYALLLSGAQAMSLRELRTLEATQDGGDLYARYYLVGSVEALLESEAFAVRAGAAPGICVNGRRLEPQMAKDLLDTELRRHADVYEADMPATLVLLNALKTVYPCN
ncbi:MAG: hypothetical protein WCK81_00345 [Betaproteobacteria bacterium]